MLILPSVGYELDSQANCLSALLFPHFFLLDLYPTLASCCLWYPIEGTALSRQSSTGSGSKIYLQPNVQSSIPAVPKLFGLRIPFAVKYFSRTPWRPGL